MFTVTHANPGTRTTVMNREAGIISVCEPSVSRWRDAREQLFALRECGRYSDNQLCSLQSREMVEGFTVVEPVYCIRGDGYWYLRNTMNIGPTHPAGHAHYASLDACVEAARYWHAEKPTHREVIMRKGMAQFMGEVA